MVNKISDSTIFLIELHPNIPKRNNPVGLSLEIEQAMLVAYLDKSNLLLKLHHSI